ncbi:hypothetical protein HDE69_000504 [Pedobacter cryoconitis]|uniref:DUF3298 domain-containing protein n=1 Tax=Pedobacter cryoconitis TaxID=188932 RepID=A0A7W8YQ28_9SPHI|nr:RsiV family protein [Pedobacter cryoconitis]MBB5619468.1 hypothetical protein [Pedobacter cryoconitis]MBB5644757.1 hypothetical protein [Pedobacter cryoconitis]
MKALFYTFCLSAFIAGCHSTEKKTSTQDTTANEAVSRRVAVQEHLPKSFYKRFQGIIGERNVVVNLSRTGNNFTGTYDYNGTQVNLITDTVINQDSIILTESGLGDRYSDDITAGPKLHLKWTGTVLSGLRVEGKEKSSIRLEETYPEGSYTFNIASYQDSIQALPKRKGSPQAVISYEYLMPAGKAPEVLWLDKQLKKIMEIPNAPSWIAGIKADAKSYLSAYRTEITGMKDEEGGLGATANYSKTQNLYIQYNGSGFAIVKHLLDSYSGGAHNNYATTLYCFDVKNQKQLALTDLVNIDSVSLQKLVEKNFRIQYKVKPGEALTTQLFDDHLAANKNFFFDTNGIAFLYNPYEVASFAQGQIVVSVPYKDLKKQLNPAFVKRMELSL